jgi:hypothetical protein
MALPAILQPRRIPPRQKIISRNHKGAPSKLRLGGSFDSQQDNSEIKIKRFVQAELGRGTRLHLHFDYDIFPT